MLRCDVMSPSKTLFLSSGGTLSIRFRVWIAAMIRTLSWDVMACAAMRRYAGIATWVVTHLGVLIGSLLGCLVVLLLLQILSSWLWLGVLGARG